MTATNHNGVYIVGQQKPNAKHHKLSAAQISEAKKRVAEYKKEKANNYSHVWGIPKI